MTNINYITNHKKNKHLNVKDRMAIQILLEQGQTKVSIAKKLGISRSTLYNELDRGTVEQMKSNYEIYTKYIADTGQLVYEKHRENSRNALKIIKAYDFIKYAEKQFKANKYSPDVCYGLAKKEKLFTVMVCTKTLYNYIDKGLMEIKNIDLPLRVKLSKKRQINRKNRRLLGNSIETRPESVNKRIEFGHWEIDTVIGTKAKSPVLLTLVERVTRKLIIVLLPNKTALSVNEAMQKIYNQYGDNATNVFKTITADNGVEFASLAEALPQVAIYYAHPYSSFERGTNERQNSLLRHFFPKGKSLVDIKPEAVKIAESYINNLPRKLLNYTYSDDLFNQYMNAL